jgi:hypothetical protein
MNLGEAELYVGMFFVCKADELGSDFWFIQIVPLVLNKPAFGSDAG